MLKGKYNNLSLARKTLLKLPYVTEKTHSKFQTFYLVEKSLARILNEGKILSIHCEKKEIWVKAQPNVFFVPHAYRNSTTLFIFLDKINRSDLMTLIENAWKEVASKKILASHLTKEAAVRPNFRSIPIYGMLICGVIILFIGSYMTANKITAIGSLKAGKSGSSGTGFISGPYAIFIGITLMIFPLYVLIKQKLKEYCLMKHSAN